jgi:hypothetical protein
MQDTTQTVSQLARQIGVQPREISDLFYKRDLPDDAAPIVAGRRRIPAELIPEIKLKLEGATAHAQ